MTAVVKDSEGNPVTGLGTLSFYYSLMGGTSIGGFSALVESSTKGTYTDSFTGKIAGTSQTLTATIAGVTLAVHPTITVVPGPVSPANSSVQFATASITAGATQTVTIVLKDAYGNAITGLASNQFRFALGGGLSSGTLGQVSEMATRGTYTVPFTGTTSGSQSVMTVVIGGVNVASRSGITVLTGAVSASRSSVVFGGASVHVGQSVSVTVVVQDSEGNAVVGLAASAFYFALAGGTSIGYFSTPLASTSSGTYTGIFVGKTAGTPTPMLPRIDGVELSTDPTIQVIP